MSSENRKKVLLGFGVLAVAVIVALALWPPSFLKEEASGAIGAVQKHRAPQITRQDVVLGNEATRRQQKILYADFLNDAAKLQSISTQLGMMAHRQVEARELESTSKQLAERELDLQSRYLDSMKGALEAAKLLSREEAASRKMEDVDAEIAQLSAVLQQKAQLSEVEMQQLNTKLAHIAEELETTAAASRHLKDADVQMAGAVADMQNRAFDGAMAKLDSAARDLNIRSLDSVSLADEVEYLAAIALEAKTLKDVEAQLGMLASRPQIELADVEVELANRASDLESKGLKNIEAQFNRDTAMAAILRDIDSQLASAKQNAQSREQNFNKELGEIQQELQAREAEFAARAAADVEFELASIQAFLDTRAQAASIAESRSEAAAQTELANVLANLQSKLASSSALASMLQNRADLEAKAGALESRARAARSAPSRRRRAL